MFFGEDMRSELLARPLEHCSNGLSSPPSPGVGFVGLFNVAVMMPVAVVWHMSSLETFEWPPNSTVWTLLLVNGLVGTVLSELLWLM